MKKFLSFLITLPLLATPAAVFAQQTSFPQASSTQVSQDVVPGTTPYAVISNESTVTTTNETTGTLNLKNIKYSVQGNVTPSTYQIDYVKPFNPSSIKGKLVRESLSGSGTPVVYNYGATKNFWVSNLSTGAYYQISSRLAYSGTKANVWVNNNQITDADAAKLGQEFDSVIYPTVTTDFGSESDVNHDGKIDILCYDIQDDYSSTGAYVAGYFSPEDLYNTPNSNQEEIFYVDTNPSMGTGSAKDVTQVYSTLAHEFQHMVNYNQKVLVQGNPTGTDTWLDEGLSMASEQIFDGHGLTDRLQYYNGSAAIQNGQSLLYWDENGDLLSNYALSYLFLQYVKIQAGQGDAIFKDIINDPHTNYQAVEDVVKKYIDPNITFGQLMTDFRIATLLKEPTGLYGFKGDPFFDGIEDRLFSGDSTYLRGGGAVITNFSGLTVPADKGQDISYNVFNMSGGPAAVASPLVNPVGEEDTQITGSSNAATVYAMAGQTEIGTAAIANGKFSLPIERQPAGTVIDVYAKDAAGNVSTPTTVIVMDMTPPAVPVVHTVGTTDTVVTGQTDAGANVQVSANGSIIGSGFAGADGTFAVEIPVQKAGTIIKIVARDAAGNASNPASVIVKAPLQGWVKQNGTWYYYHSGKKATGWLKVNGSWYYLDMAGAMKIGWLKLGTKTYYLIGTGAMKTGWLKLGATWYYFDATGAMKTGWLKLGTNTYYLTGTGAKKTGWLKLGKAWYYFDGSGRMKTGWITINGKRYEFNSRGVWIK